MKFTLKPRKPQGRDYSFHKSYKLGSAPFANELLFLSPVLDQGELDECTAYAGVATRCNEINAVLDPSAFWTQECAFDGSDGSQGFDLQVPAATAVEKGFPNYNPTSYFWITSGGGQDLFDNVRSAIQINQRPVIGGLTWQNEWTLAPNGIINALGTSPLGGHCIKIAGWTTINNVPYVALQNSWGIGYGVNGVYYMTREVFNAVFPSYGVFFWSDDTNPTVKVLGLITALYQNILSLFQSHTAGTYPPPSRIPQLVQGIFEAEGGGKQGGVQYNNWGDLRGRTGNKYLASLGATGYGENDLAIFPTLEIGTQACIQLVTDACNGLLLAYKPSMTLPEFVTVYGDPQTTKELNDYVAILENHVGKVETIADLL